LSEKDSIIHLNRKELYNCANCNIGAVPKMEMGKMHIIGKIKCDDCIEKKCGSCDENETTDFAVPYQTPIDEEYYKKFFTNTGVPWFSAGVNEDVKRETEGKHPLIIKDIVDGGNVLDVGCGQGWLVGFLRELGVEAYGVDYSKYAIENSFHLAKQYVSLCDAQKLPYEDNSFDMVIAREVFEHLTVRQAINVFHEICRVCKPNGLMYFTIWLNFYKFHWVSPYILCKDYRDPSHVTYMPRGFWLDLFENYTYVTINNIPEIESKLDWMNKGRVFVYRSTKY
jgi:SAM-dependent methyltransferase